MMRPTRVSNHSRSSRKQSNVDAGDNADEAGPRSYTITGCLAADFAGICRERGMPFVPDTVPRPKPPAKPPKPRLFTDQKTAENDAASKKAKTPAKKRQRSARKESDKLSRKSSVLPVEETSPVSKTKFEFFKPCVQVEQDDPEDDRTVTEVYIRGWKVDMAMMEVLERCLPAVPLLRLLHLWNAGLSRDTVNLLATFLPLCTNMTTLQLDGNSLAGVPLGQLVGVGTAPLRRLSLRFCSIGDAQLEQLAYRVGWMHAEKQNLVMLDLAGNQIGDEGVAVLAESLKTNRSLGAINLRANRVGDKGAAHLAEVFTWFPIQGKLFQTRSQLLHEQLESEQVISMSKSELDESNNAKLKSYKNRHPLSMSAPGSKHASREKLSTKSLSKSPSSSCELRRHLGPHHLRMVSAIVLPALILFSNSPRFAHTPVPDRFIDGGVRTAQEGSHSLLRGGYMHKGLIWLPGNRTLHSLNLSRNQVGEKGIKTLLTAMEEQVLVVPHEPQGLQCLDVTNNCCPANNPHLQRLTRLMHHRNTNIPFPFINLLKEFVMPCALPISVLV